MYSEAGITDGKAFRTRPIEKNYNNLQRIDMTVSVDKMYLFVKRGNEQEIVKLTPQIHNSVLYHYLHKKHAHLVPKITAVLNKMEASGELQMIQERSRKDIEQNIRNQY